MRDANNREVAAEAKMEPETILTAGMAAVRVAVKDIAPTNFQRTIDADVVDLIARTVDVDGLLYPIIVQQASMFEEQRRPPYELVSGAHRLEAHKKLGRTFIHAYVLPKNSHAVAYRLHLIENFARSELPLLERAEAIYMWIHNKGGQSAHPLRKNRQPHDAGVSRAAKDLGISRRAVQRSLKIAKLGSSAKHTARELNLDTNERLLLEVAAMPVDEQVDALRTFASYMRADSEDARQVRLRWAARLVEIWDRGRPEWRAQALVKLAEREAKNTLRATTPAQRRRPSGNSRATAAIAKAR